MNYSEGTLLTPIYLRMSDEMPWPEDKVFYLLTGDGLFLCRNNENFRSCVPARRYPGELARQEKFIDLRYPRLPRHLIEQAVGFFEAVGRRHDAEAALLLVREEDRETCRLVVPRQRCTVYESWQGIRYPQGVHYDLPERLPEGWTIIGDIHSHVDYSAYSSATDQYDERYRTGLHIVVGRIYDEPPEFHVEATVDGVRFPVPADQAFEKYMGRRETFPREWFDWLEIDVTAASYASTGNSWKSGASHTSGHGYGTVSSSPGSWSGGGTGTQARPASGGRSGGNGQGNSEDDEETDTGRRTIQ